MRAPGPARALLLAAVLGAAGCGGRTDGSADATLLRLDAVATPVAQATASVDTSPDGGIYRNPDHVDVLLVGTRPMADVRRALGDAAAGWDALVSLGDPTLIGLRVRNDGKATSEPTLDDLQVASDFAPAAATGGLRHWYHPLYPLAALAADPMAAGSGCTLHLDPGQATEVVLVYPPLRPSPTLLWGRYHGFGVTLRPGGSMGALPARLHTVACTPPPAPSP